LIRVTTGRTVRADASFSAGNRIFHVICEVTTMEAFEGRAFALMASPIALFVDEEERSYSIPLTAKKMEVEEILRLVPSLRERSRNPPSHIPDRAASVR
jgi:hypothetical protein